MSQEDIIMQKSRDIATMLRVYIKDSTINDITNEIVKKDSIAFNSAKECIYDFLCGDLKRKLYPQRPHIKKNLKRLALIYKIIGFQANHEIVSLTKEINPYFEHIFQNQKNPKNLSSTIIKTEKEFINYISNIYRENKICEFKTTTPKKILNLMFKHFPEDITIKLFKKHRKFFYQDPPEQQPFCENKTQNLVNFLANNGQISCYLKNLKIQKTN